MKTFLKWFAGIIVVIAVAYGVGPKPSKPDFKIQEISLPASLTDLEKQINDSEKSVKGIKPDNQARIVWQVLQRKKRQKLPFSTCMVSQPVRLREHRCIPIWQRSIMQTFTFQGFQNMALTVATAL